MNYIDRYRNKVYNKDVLSLLKDIPDNSIDMIYGDPDYNVGIQYSGKSYKRKWAEYIDWYIQLSQQSLRALKKDGNLFLLNYPKQNAYLRVKYLDENAYDVFDYVWVYNSNIGHSKRKLTNAHRSILHVTKSKHNRFYKNNIAQPYKNPEDKRIIERIKKGEKGRMPYSWLYFDLVKNVSKDKTFHSCQIPLKLVELLIKSSTLEGDDVFILFGGSGSEIILTKNLKRNFLSCEIHHKYYQMILDRLKTNGEIKDDYRLEFIKEKNKRKRKKTQQENIFESASKSAL